MSTKAISFTDADGNKCLPECALTENDAYGYYLKFVDGTAIRFGELIIPEGSFVVTALFPEFTSIKSCVACPVSTLGLTEFGAEQVDINTVHFGRAPNTNATKFSYIAIGRWK